MLAGLLGESSIAVLTEADAGAPEEYAGLLDRAERENDQVLLAADTGDGEGWRAFCLRQADRTLLVAEGPPEPGVRAPKTEGPLRPAPGAGAPPSGSLGDWIDALGVPSGRLIGPRAEWERTLAPLARSLQGTLAWAWPSRAAARAASPTSAWWRCCWTRASRSTASPA